MREIKFRAWVPAQQKMYGPVTLDEMRTRWSYPLYWCQPLMQYTGLKDKSGKEIYEGDILDDEGSSCVIAWDEDRYGWGVIDEPYWQFYEHMKIIGNIYENPELLEAKDE